MSDDLGNNCAQPQRHAARQRSSGLLRGRDARREQVAGLLRMSIASAVAIAAGANEAPPVSLDLLGDQLTDIFEQIEKGGARTEVRRRAGHERVEPAEAPATRGRNRTSPFAFTGTSSSSARCRQIRASRFPTSR
jgi:glutamine synthetase type III